MSSVELTYWIAFYDLEAEMAEPAERDDDDDDGTEG